MLIKKKKKGIFNESKIKILISQINELHISLYAVVKDNIQLNTQNKIRIAVNCCRFVQLKSLDH